MSWPGARQRSAAKGGEGEGGAVLAAEDARGDADVAHAEADGWHLALSDQAEHADVVVGAVGHRADLDDVGVEFGQALVDAFEVVGGLTEVVEADEALGLAVAGDLAGDVVLEVDILHPLGDGRAEEHEPLRLGLGPFSAVAFAAAGDHDRAGAVGQQSLDVDLAVDVVESEFDELRPLFGEVAMLGDHVAVTSAADTNADHGEEIAGSKGVEFPSAKRDRVLFGDRDGTEVPRPVVMASRFGLAQPYCCRTRRGKSNPAR